MIESKTLETIDLIDFMNRATILFFKIRLLYSPPSSYYSTASFSEILMSVLL